MSIEQRASLRVRSLQARLANHPQAERVFEYARQLDGWIHEWARYAARKGLREDERMRALAMLTSMRRDFNALVAEADARNPLPAGVRDATDFGTALDALTDEERRSIAEILGLAYEPKYRALFEVKAAEYIEQDELWNEITGEAGFTRATNLESDAPLSAVILTYSGSLLLLSAPFEKNFRRKYIYQSIYAGHLPTEGTCGVLSSIDVNHPVLATRIRTSPVRKIGVSSRQELPWELQQETFARLLRHLSGAMTIANYAPSDLLGAPMPPPSSEEAPHTLRNSESVAAVPRPVPTGSPGATLWDGTRPLDAAALDSHRKPPPTPTDPIVSDRPGPQSSRAAASQGIGNGTAIPSVFFSVLHSERQREAIRQLEAAARAELRTLLAHVIEPKFPDGGHAISAEILGQVMQLQRLGLERGELHSLPHAISRLETENNDSVSTRPDGIAVGRVGHPPEVLVGGNFGTQTIVRGAPVALLTEGGALYAVLGNVRSFLTLS